MKRIWDRFSRLTWAVVLVGALIGAGGGLLRMYLKDYNYSATATVYVTPPVSSSASDALVADQYAANRTQLYVKLIQSPELAQMVKDRLQLSQSPDELVERVEGSATPLTSLLSITAEGISPGDARNLAVAYAESLSEFAKRVEGSGGLRGSPSVVTVAYPVPEDPGFIDQYGLILALAAGAGLLGFLYSYWYRRRYPTVRTPEQLRRELHIALTDVVDVDSPHTHLRRLQAELFSPVRNEGGLMVVGARADDGVTAFSELLVQSIEAAGRDVRVVSSPPPGQHDGLVIVDIPALLESNACAATLTDSGCEQAVLVTRRNSTTLRDARDVCDMLNMNNVALRGAIILRRNRLPWQRRSTPVQPVADEDDSESPWPVIDVLEAENHKRTVRAD